LASKVALPVIWCAPKGVLLVMRAATRLKEEEFVRRYETGGLPDWKHVPFSTEVTPFEQNKAADFGWLDGRLVAVDYAADPALTDRCVEPYTAEAARAPGYELG